MSSDAPLAPGPAVARAFLLLLVVLPLGVAGAAQAADVRGDLAFRDAPRLEGRLVAEASHGGLDLAEAVRAGAPLRVSWAAAEGTVLWSTRDAYGDAVWVGEEHGNASFRWGPGELANLSCARDCRAFLFARAGGLVAVEGDARGALASMGEDGAYWTGSTAQGEPDAFSYPYGADWVRVEGLAGAAARAEGDVGLLLWGIYADAAHDGRAEEVRTGTEEGPLEGPGGLVVGTRSEKRALVLRLSGASLDLAPGAPVLLLAPRPALTLDGVLASGAATGVLEVDGRPVRLDDEAVRLAGALRLEPAFAAAGGPLGDGEAARATVAGKATVGVGGASVASVPARGVAGLTLAALLLALLAWLKASALAVLYTRLVRATLLRNENRRRILDAVRARPGVHVRELSRATGLALGVVRHHVEVLAKHGLLLDRSEGGVRALFVPDGALDRARQEAVLALKDGTRRRLAETLAGAGAALSQQELAARTGLSQRLVSHHLARLEKAGLVASSGSMPRRYAPTPGLVAMAGGKEER